MGKSKNCTPAELKTIVELKKAGLSYQRIASQSNCSKTNVFDAIAHFHKYETTENVPRKRDHAKPRSALTKKMVRLSKIDPKKSAAAIRREIMDENNIEISKRMVACRLVEAGLHAEKTRTFESIG